MGPAIAMCAWGCGQQLLVQGRRRRFSWRHTDSEGPERSRIRFRPWAKSNVMALAGIMLPSLYMSGAAALVHARVSLGHRCVCTHQADDISPMAVTLLKSPHGLLMAACLHPATKLVAIQGSAAQALAPTICTRPISAAFSRMFECSGAGGCIVAATQRQWPPRPVQPAVKIAVFDYETVTDVCATAKKGHALDKYDVILLEAYDDQEQLLLNTTTVQELLHRDLGSRERPVLVKGPETPSKAVRIWDAQSGLRLVMMFSQDDLVRYLRLQGWSGLIDLDTEPTDIEVSDFDMLEPTKTYRGANVGIELMLSAQRVQQLVAYTRGKQHASATAVYTGTAHLARVTQATIVGDKVAYRAVLQRSHSEFDGLALLEGFAHPRFSHVTTALVAYAENLDYGREKDVIDFHKKVALLEQQLRHAPEQIQFVTEDNHAHYNAQHIVRTAIDCNAHVVPFFRAPWLHPDIVRNRVHKEFGVLLSTVGVGETPVL
eukprot:jgi/Chlat1/8116/Chrsp75S07594